MVNIKNFNMANGHGGKREGAKRPKLPFETKEIRWRITANNFKTYAKPNETYEEFFERREIAVFEAIRAENAKDLQGIA
jgi:hypothetical protein